jgi:hypothetical protein
MSLTHNDYIFVIRESDETYNYERTYDYYCKIEDQDYFRPRPTFKNFGNFRTHGKYVSNFHPGKIPNEYYCPASEAMTLRSGTKLNYVKEGFFWHDANEVSFSFNGRPEGRCLSAKKMIWFWESYHHLLSTCYELTRMYDVSRAKIKEFIRELEKSVPGICQNVKFEKKFDSDGDWYNELEPSTMPTRDTDGKFVFCNCHYTVIKNEEMAIEREGHHRDEFLPMLRKLDKMYSKPHRIVKNSRAFKAVDRRINDDCRRLIFNFLTTEDIKATTIAPVESATAPVPAPAPKPVPRFITVGAGLLICPSPALRQALQTQ